MNKSQFQINYNEILGKGGFGTVYLGTLFNEEVAIKKSKGLGIFFLNNLLNIK